jgi:autotransporter-associated beta strand protein
MGGTHRHGIVGRGATALATLTAILGLGLAAHAQNLYWGGGTTDIGDGTPLPTTAAGLNGTWDTTTANWATSVSGATYISYVNGAFANLGYYTDSAANAIVTVDGNKTISGMFMSLTPAANFNREFSFNGTAVSTKLTLGGDNATFLVGSSDATRGMTLNATGGNLSLGTSSATLVKDGGGKLWLGNNSTFVSNDDFTGDVLVRSGSFNIDTQSSLSGVSRFDLIGYRPNVTVTNANGNQGFTSPTFLVNLPNTAGIVNRVNDDATITLTRGTFDLRAGGASKPTENIGSVILEGAGIIGNGQGAANGATWNIGSLSRGSNGRGTAVMTVAAGDVLQHDIRITDPGTIPTDVLLPWFPTSRAEWLMIDSANSNQLTRIASTNADLNAVIWTGSYDGSTNLRVNGVLANALTGNLALNSFGFLGTGTASTLDLGGNTLTLNAGALGLYPSGGSVAYTINNGTIQTIDGKPLYINTGWSNTSTLVLDSVLTGSMDVYISGSTNVAFGPSPSAAGTPNTYTGTVYVNSGTLNLNKDAAITGDVVIATGGGVVLNRTAGIASSANITIGRDALFNTADKDSTFSGVLTNNGGQILMINNPSGVTLSNPGTGLIFNGGLIVQNSGAVNYLNLRTNVSYAASSEEQAVVRNFGTGGFSIRLNTGASAGNAERTFDIADSATLPSGQSEMLIDTIIANGGSGSTTGSIRKIGGGTLALAGTNTYTGGTVVDEGVLRLSRIQAAAQSGLAGTFTNVGVEADTLTFTAPVTGSMAPGQTVAGTNISAGRVITGIANDYQVYLNGTVGSANSSATDIAVGAVDRIGSLSTGAVLVNNGGALLLDAGTTVGGTVDVNVGGVLAGSGTVVGAATITGTVSPGSPAAGPGRAGTLTFNSTLAFRPGSWVEFDLGTESDLISFFNLGDNLVGSGNAVLSLNLGPGFDYANSYTVITNVTTAGFTFLGITGYDTSNHTALLNQVGDDYVLTFNNDPTPLAEVFVLGVSGLVPNGGLEPVFPSEAGIEVTPSPSYLIGNAGDLAMTVGLPVSVSGAMNCSAAVSIQPSSPVAPGGDTTMVLSVTPAAPGPWQATVSFTCNDFANTPYTWTVSGDAGARLLTVNSGNGDGWYQPGEEVSIQANLPPKGEIFAQWIGDVATVDDVYSAATTLTMPATAAEITATYAVEVPLTMAVSPVASGTTSPPEGGPYMVPEGIPVSIRAMAAVGYGFVNWTVTAGSASFGDANLADTTVTVGAGGATIQAVFADANLLTYIAGPNGLVNGAAVFTQTVFNGDDGTVVTAQPDLGFHFETWSDGLLTAARQETNVTGDLTVTATFAINVYDVTFAVVGNGTVDGNLAQTVTHGGDASAVEAVADEGYHFAGWIGGYVGMDNPLTVTGVTGDLAITATFAINEYVLTYIAGTNGTVDGVGVVTQTVSHGSDGTLVTAIPDEGYNFVDWSDAPTDNPRQDLSVTGDITVTANFAINVYDVTFAAVGNGTVVGDLAQTVTHGGDATAVEAVPDPGQIFTGWTGDYVGTDNPLTITGVTGDLAITALFAEGTPLTIVVDPFGTGTTNPPEGGPYTLGVGVPFDIAAFPAAGQAFAGWTSNAPATTTFGDASAMTTTVTVAEMRSEPSSPRTSHRRAS